MIIGTGVDIVEIARIRGSVERFGDAFINRIFTSDEWAYCSRKHDPIPSLAVRFAAREALIKALPHGASSIALKEMEVVMGRAGKPGFRPGPALAQAFIDLGIHTAHLSLSHERTHAIAYVVLEGSGAD
jgi:holo-[acyl-carrier protein] synthase